MPAVAPAFGTLIRHRRTARRMSQLALAAEAEVFARHLCFLFILERQEPYPAIVVDGAWNTVLTNEAPEEGRPRTMLATPHDVTLELLRIECFYPADEKTEDTARRLAGARSG